MLAALNGTSVYCVFAPHLCCLIRDRKPFDAAHCICDKPVMVGPHDQFVAAVQGDPRLEVAW